jgi:hypothetical protein
VFGLGAGLLGLLLAEPVAGLVAGVATGLLVGQVVGGEAFVQHLSVRYAISRCGCGPWNYVRFLDYCTDRILLRKVGGGYIFIHRLLQEHFAAMEDKQDYE